MNRPDKFNKRLNKALNDYYSKNGSSCKDLILGREEFDILCKMSEDAGVKPSHGMVYKGMNVWHMQGYRTLMVVGNINNFLNGNDND